MLTKVIELRVVEPFSLRVVFNDGRQGVHDCARLLQENGSLLQPLREPAYFARAFLDFGAPTWPNGFDMAPEWLLREMADAGELTASAA
jgi:hypothetical protein